MQELKIAAVFVHREDGAIPIAAALIGGSKDGRANQSQRTKRGSAAIAAARKRMQRLKTGAGQ